MRIFALFVLTALMTAAAVVQAPSERPRAREFGIKTGVLDPGPLNAITDVAGVAVGHTSHSSKERTSGPASRPSCPTAGNIFQDKVPAAVFVANGFGKLTGSTQVARAGNARNAHRPDQHPERPDGGRRRHRLHPRPGREQERRVGQSGDRGDERRLAERHPRPARPEGARPGRHPEGGGRAGRRGLGRRRNGNDRATGSRAESGRARGSSPPAREATRSESSSRRTTEASSRSAGPGRGKAAADLRQRRAGDSGRPADPAVQGSCMIVVATDAPLDARNLGRLAQRATSRHRPDGRIQLQRERRLRDRVLDGHRSPRPAPLGVADANRDPPPQRERLAALPRRGRSGRGGHPQFPVQGGRIEGNEAASPRRCPSTSSKTLIK